MSIETIYQALDEAKDSNSIIRDWAHLETGYGTQRFHLWVGKRETPVLAAVKTSLVRTGGDTLQCPFTIVKSDLWAWRAVQTQRIHTTAHGYLLVPIWPDQVDRTRPTSVLPLAWFPFNRLMRPTRLPWSRCIFQSFAGVLEQHGARDWRLRVPVSGNAAFALTQPYGGVVRLPR